MAKHRKGERKRKKGQFQSRNKFHLNRKSKNIISNSQNAVVEKVIYVRLDNGLSELVKNQPIMSGALPKPGPSNEVAETPVDYKLLRSKHVPSTVTETTKSRSDAADDYKVIYTSKLWEMVNFVNREHQERNPTCKGDLSFHPHSSEGRGVSTRERAYCKKCTYTSKLFTLYEEVETGKRGRRAATINLGLSVAMSQTPVGPTSVRKLLMGSNIRAPSRSGMQKTANKVSNLIQSENDADLKRIRQLILEVNKYRSHPEFEIIVQGDGQYNNKLFSAVGRSPFQAGTQASYTMAENITTKKLIVALEAINKLCSKHGFHTKNDEKCDIKTGQCSATASMETTIGNEKAWAKNCLLDLRKDGLEVSHMITDADTGASQAATELFTAGITRTEPKHQLDTRHLAENHRKQMSSCQRLFKMMPGHNAAYRHYVHGRFVLDLSKRCQAEFNKIHKQENGNFTRICDRVKKSINAIKRCYSGDHSRCSTYSAVCKGDPNDNWINKSAFLTKKFKIDLSSSENEETLLGWIEFRLGDDMLEQTRLNANTQKLEGTNRAIRRSLPKDVTFTRNFTGRLNSAVHSVNNGPGVSLVKLCQAAGCPLPSDGTVASQLMKEQEIAEKKRKMETTHAYKKKRKLRRNLLYKLHEQNRENTMYIKAQLLKNRRAHVNRARKIALKTAQKIAHNSVINRDHSNYSRKIQMRGKIQAGECSHAKTPELKQ